MKMSTAIGVMNAMKNGVTNSDLDALGISPTEMTLLGRDSVWTAQDRAVVMRTLDALIHGTMDVLGLPRFQLNAEYVAVHIFAYVDPCNYFAACSWAQRVPTTESMLSAEESDPITAKELFAYLVQINDADGNQVFRERFHKSTEIKEKKAEKQIAGRD